MFHPQRKILPKHVTIHVLRILQLRPKPPRPLAIIFNRELIMIILLPPLELHRFGNEVLADFVIDVGLVGLAELVATGHTVHLAVLDEMAPTSEVLWESLNTL